MRTKELLKDKRTINTIIVLEGAALVATNVLGFVLASAAAIIATLIVVYFPERSKKEDAVKHLQLALAAAYILTLSGFPVTENGLINAEGVGSLIAILMLPAGALEGYIIKRK